MSILVVTVLVAAAFALVPEKAQAAPAVSDSYYYDASHSTGEFSFPRTSMFGQMFWPDEGTLDSVRMCISRPVGATGQAWVEIYRTSSGGASVPTGTPVATSAPLDFGVIPTASVGFLPNAIFAFDNTVSLDRGSSYFIVLKHNSPATLSVSRDSAAYYWFSGNAAQYTPSLGWVTDYRIAYFEVYQTPAPIIVSSNSFPLLPARCSSYNATQEPLAGNEPTILSSGSGGYYRVSSTWASDGSKHQYLRGWGSLEAYMREIPVNATHAQSSGDGRYVVYQAPYPTPDSHETRVYVLDTPAQLRDDNGCRRRCPRRRHVARANRCNQRRR